MDKETKQKKVLGEGKSHTPVVNKWAKKVMKKVLAPKSKNSTQQRKKRTTMEEVVPNNVGSGHIAGTGDDPPVKRKKKVQIHYKVTNPKTFKKSGMKKLAKPYLTEGFVWTPASTEGLVNLVGATNAAWIMIGLVLLSIGVLVSGMGLSLKEILKDKANFFRGLFMDKEKAIQFSEKVRVSLSGSKKGYSTQLHNQLLSAINEKDYKRIKQIMDSIKQYAARNDIKESTEQDSFNGSRVFVVPSEYFHNCRMSKRKYARYEDYVGNDELGEAIRSYGNSNYGNPIIVQDEATGAMCYLRYGNIKLGENVIYESWSKEPKNPLMYPREKTTHVLSKNGDRKLTFTRWVDGQHYILHSTAYRNSQGKKRWNGDYDILDKNKTGLSHRDIIKKYVKSEKLHEKLKGK